MAARLPLHDDHWRRAAAVKALAHFCEMQRVAGRGKSAVPSSWLMVPISGIEKFIEAEGVIVSGGHVYE
jgi:hypothetical protein